MDIEKTKATFKRKLPDFVDFHNPGQDYLESEYNYKLITNGLFPIWRMNCSTIGLGKLLTRYHPKPF